MLEDVLKSTYLVYVHEIIKCEDCCLFPMVLIVRVLRASIYCIFKCREKSAASAKDRSLLNCSLWQLLN